MNVIFLDIDGVLNSQDTVETCNGLIGIDSDKVARLAEIVNTNNAKLLLTSSWRRHWWKRERDTDEQHPVGEYLDKKLAEHGLKIHDVVSYVGFNRGRAIKDWISSCPDVVDSYIILDDDEFDYGESEVGLLGHLVKTSFYGKDGGLQDTHVRFANRKFKNPPPN